MLTLIVDNKIPVKKIHDRKPLESLPHLRESRAGKYVNKYIFPKIVIDISKNWHKLTAIII